MAHRKSATIALIGLRCSGKTSVGRRLALVLARPFVDLDAVIAERFRVERALGDDVTAGEILTTFGEETFRDAEEEALAHVIANEPRCVLATGGGVVERAENRDLLAARAFCIWLKVSSDELVRRWLADARSRPSLTDLDPHAEVDALSARRAPHYGELADLEIDCQRLSSEELARRISARLRDEAAEVD